MVNRIGCAAIVALALAGCNSGDTTAASTTAATGGSANPAPTGQGSASRGDAAEGLPENVVLRMSSSPQMPSSVYFSIRGNGTPRVITSISSPDADRVEIHESRMDGGMMSMAPVTSIPVPADGVTTLRPGGLHLMVFGIKDAARAAGEIDLTIRFESSPSIDTTAVAMPASANTTAAAAEDHSAH